MHKISIIISVYNVEHYLPQCLDSVINQTYQNLEIILVNDGATDLSPKICDDYAFKDDRIKVIHQKNAGVGMARNTGLNLATGNFISFVDSDDLLSVSFYSRLMQVAIENSADIVECDFIKFEEKEDLDKQPEILKESIEIYSTEAALELLMKEYLKQIVWNKIYRREVIMDLIFPKDKINDDEFWTYKVFGNSKIIVKISDNLYFYRQHSTSLMGESYGLRRLEGILGLEERIDYIEENFPKLKNLAIKTFCLASLWHYQQVEKNKEIDPQKIFRKKIFYKMEQYNNVSILKNWRLKEIIAYQLFIWSPKIYIKFREIFDNLVAKTTVNEK